MNPYGDPFSKCSEQPFSPFYKSKNSEKQPKTTDKKVASKQNQPQATHPTQKEAPVEKPSKHEHQEVAPKCEPEKIPQQIHPPVRQKMQDDRCKPHRRFAFVPEECRQPNYKFHQ